jgi:hypothetical protein
MKRQSRIIIHVGINFITVPAPLISQQTLLGFQQAVLNQGLEYNRMEMPKNAIVLLRDAPYPLQISVMSHESQVGQLLVVTPQPKGSLELFVSEADAAIQAFESVWPATNRQIVRADATIRMLYETTGQHAFQELWESRLGQSSQALSIFDRPVLGGGLRFVLNPVDEELPNQIEIKIESLLSDSTKILVETQFTWPIPTAAGISFQIKERIESMKAYIDSHVEPFIVGAKS